MTCENCINNKPKQLEIGDKEEYRLVFTIRQVVNDEQNQVCYDDLLAIYSTLKEAGEVAKHLMRINHEQ